MTALIDADAIVYIAAWHHRESDDTEALLASVDGIINNMLLLTHATGYYGALSSRECFRHKVYKYAPYKGNRKEKEPWLRDKELVIKERMTNYWGFFRVDDLEADDVVCWLAYQIRNFANQCGFVVCSPDKDLQQIPGVHYNFTKDQHTVVSVDEADLNLWGQMLTGDATDNICGVPGIGPKKADELLKAANRLERAYIVEQAYKKYFGNYYGSVIFEETLQTVKLLCPGHPHERYYYPELSTNFGDWLHKYTPQIVAPTSASEALSGLFGIK